MTHHQLETKYYKLERLIKWDRCNEVNEMLMGGMSPHKVSEWCKENGFSISHPKLYEYKEYLQEALTRHITVERMLGIGVPKRKPILLQTLGLTSTKNLVKNEMEVLDAIVQRGYDALMANPVMKVQDALRAIELKNKLTQGAHAGLTGYGLDQLRELEQAKFNAVLTIVQQYLPEDKHEELQSAIEKAERTFYETSAPEFLEEYERSLEEEYASPEATVVSDE